MYLVESNPLIVVAIVIAVSALGWGIARYLKRGRDEWKAYDADHPEDPAHPDHRAAFRLRRERRQ